MARLHPFTRQRLRRTALLLLLGLATSISIAWAIAALKPNTIYPSATMGALVHWDRSWSIRETRGVGTLQLSWVDLRAMISPTTDLEEFRAAYQQHLLDIENKEKTHRYHVRMREIRGEFIVRNKPPRWGTMAAAPLPIRRRMPESTTPTAGQWSVYGTP